MAGPVRRRLARLIYRVVAGSPLPEDPAPPAVTPKPRAEQPDEVPGERLADVRGGVPGSARRHQAPG
jgi:hypothetical protein